MADELDVPSDKVRGFSIANNQFRIHWVLNVLINERFSEAEREAIYRGAMSEASIGWSCDFAERCVGYFRPEEADRDRGEPIVSETVAEEFRALSLAKLRAAAADGSLVDQNELTRSLFEWMRLGADGPAEIRAWTDASLAIPAFVVAMAKDIPSESFSHGMGWDGMGDRVSRRTVRVNFRPYEDILDVPAFEGRVGELIESGDLCNEDLQALIEFRDTPRGGHERDD